MEIKRQRRVGGAKLNNAQMKSSAMIFQKTRENHALFPVLLQRLAHAQRGATHVDPFWSTFGMVPGLINTFKVFLFSPQFFASPLTFFFLLPFPSIYLCALFLPLRRYVHRILWRRLNRFLQLTLRLRSALDKRFCESVPNWPVSITLLSHHHPLSSPRNTKK